MNPIELVEQDEDYRRLPDALRQLLDLELAAGNKVVEIFHSFPAPPVGACFKLAQQLITRSPQTSDGLDYRKRNSSLYSGEITDANRFFFLIEPPLPPEPEPNMETIREESRPPQFVLASHPMLSPLVDRFKTSMVMDFEKWYDGIGYDISLLAQMNDDERAQIEHLILRQSNIDWFDVEALALIKTPAARERLEKAATDGNFAVRNAVQCYAPDLVAAKTRTESLVKALSDASLYGGLSEALDEAEEFHPPEVIEALLHGAKNRDGETATLMAAMLFYLHGVTEKAFDMSQRSFFLRFNTTDQTERATAFSELCQRIGRQVIV